MYELEQQKRSVSLATALILYAVRGGKESPTCMHTSCVSQCLWFLYAYAFIAYAGICVCVWIFFII